MEYLRGWVKFKSKILYLVLCLILVCSISSASNGQFDLGVHQGHFLAGEFDAWETEDRNYSKLKIKFKDGCTVVYTKFKGDGTGQWRWIVRNIHGQTM